MTMLAIINYEEEDKRSRRLMMNDSLYCQHNLILRDLTTREKTYFGRSSTNHNSVQSRRKASGTPRRLYSAYSTRIIARQKLPTTPTNC